MSEDARNSIFAWGAVTLTIAAFWAWVSFGSGLLSGPEDLCEIEGENVEMRGVVIWSPGPHGSDFGFFIEMEKAPPTTDQDYPAELYTQDPRAMRISWGAKAVREIGDENGFYAFGNWRGVLGSESEHCPMFFGENGVLQVEGVTELQVLQSPPPLNKPDSGSSPE